MICLKNILVQNMKDLIKLLLISGIIQIVFVACEDNLDTHQENGVLQMYKMDDYGKCREQGGSYCLYDFKITTMNNSSEIWRKIEESQHDIMKLDKSYLHRMYCVLKEQGSYKDYGIYRAQQELDNNVTIGILSMQCSEEAGFPIHSILIIILLLIGVLFIIYTTWQHYVCSTDPFWPKTGYEKFCHAFSIIKNYQKLTGNNENEDFQRLKSIQGIRVINTALVVFWHTVNSLFMLYIDNTDELELSYNNPVIFYLMFLGAFSVQIFFVISTFLLTNQILELHGKHGKFTIKMCFIILLNRLFRFAPALVVMIAISRLNFYNWFPHLIKPSSMINDACARNGLHTLLQLSFLVPFSEICTPGLWYLSLNTIYFATTVVVLYVTLKYSINTTSVAAVLTIGFCFIFGVYNYINKADFIFQPYPKVFHLMFSSTYMDLVHISPFASWSSGFIGILLGNIYFHAKNQKERKINIKWNIIWWLVYVCIPILALYVSTRSYEGITKSIVAAILKPIFVAALGIGILGMAFGLGGIVRKFLELKLFVILSHMTYCTYIFHFFVDFGRGIFFSELIHFKAYHMILWIIFDIVASFGIGAVATVMIEFPGLSLQKMFVPQIGEPDELKSMENNNKPTLPIPNTLG